jgi:hypothetical protein
MPDEELTVFYAWQSDSPSRDNRNFIESALEQAFKNLHKSGKVQSSPRLDKDTKDIPGIPDIANTILDKIRVADVFVADVSFVGTCPPHDAESKLMPNPNVMLELGYALSELGWERIGLVINTTTGSQENLPFDLRNRRWPVAYRLATNASNTERADEKKKLTKQFEDAIGAIAKLPPRQKKGTTTQRLDALEMVVSSLSSSIAQYTTLANSVNGLQKVTAGGGSGNEANDPKSKCKTQLDDLVKRLAAGKFENVTFQPGMLAIAICPTSSPSPLPIFEKKAHLSLRPLNVSSWNSRTYGERLVTSPGSRGPISAATEITIDGCVNAVGHEGMGISPDYRAFAGRTPPADAIGIPSVAYEKDIIEAVFDYIAGLKTLGTTGPWYVAIGIVNLKKSILYVDTRFSFSGQVFEGDEIMPPVVEVSADIALENPQAIARALRPIFDYVWREHGYPKSFNYAETGDWVGR